MPDLRLQQLHFETGSIKRLLVFMMEENVHMKNRIAEVLKNAFENKILGKMELFQNRFIMEDEVVGLLRNDVAELERLLHKQDAAHYNFVIDDIEKKVRKLSYNMENTESQFMRLKAEFNNFLLDIMSSSGHQVVM